MFPTRVGEATAWLFEMQTECILFFLFLFCFVFFPLLPFVSSCRGRGAESNAAREYHAFFKAAELLCCALLFRQSTGTNYD